MHALTENSIDVGGGFYTAAEAARLLGIDGPQRIVRWLTAPKGRGEPVIRRQYARVGKEHELSFLDLLEVRFVEHFRRRGISLQSLRVAAHNARRELGEHPFARSGAAFQSDRKQVFLQTAREADDRIFLNLMTNQIEMYDIIEQLLDEDLTFSIDGLAREWRPQPARSPNVIVSPRHAFGAPAIGERRRVPTKALFSTWVAESDYDRVADWFGVTADEVREAVRFEVGTPH